MRHLNTIKYVLTCLFVLVSNKEMVMILSDSYG